MCIGGCTWQWIQRTVQEPTDQGSLLPPNVTQSQKASHAHVSYIRSHHIRHARRLLRLFRHALAKQAYTTMGGSSALHSSELSVHMPAAMSRASDSHIAQSTSPCSGSTVSIEGASPSAVVHNFTPLASCQVPLAAAAAPESAAAHAPAASRGVIPAAAAAPESATAQAPSAVSRAASAAAHASDSATSRASSALKGAASAAATDPTSNRCVSACTQAASAAAQASSTAAGRDPASRPLSKSIDKAALFSQAKPSTQPTILVEAIIPVEQLHTNSCHTPCLLNFSVAPHALSSECYDKTVQANASTEVPEGINAQRKYAENLVRQHVQNRDYGWNVNGHIQLSSSIKVSNL